MKNSILILFFFISLAAHAQQTDSSKVDSTNKAKSVAPAAAPVVAPAAAAVAPPATAAAKTGGDTRPFIDRLRLGGSTGFWIDPRKTYIEVAASLAYSFPKMLTTGVGFRYIYTHDRVYNKNLNTYGPSIFARLTLTRHIYIWAEQEVLKTEYYVPKTTGKDASTESTSVGSTFLGLGFVRSFRKSGRGGLSIQVLYNFAYDREDHSPYYSPVIYRVGYFF